MLSAIFALLLLCLFPEAVHAQTTTRYTNTTDSATNGISDTATPCTTPLTRTFTVSTNYLVSDVNIGILLAHTYRSDLTLRLRAPDNTVVTFMTATGGDLDNINMLMDDGDPDTIASDTTNDIATAATVVPAYADTRNTSNALAALAGKNALGTWTLEICDGFTGDKGTFYQADLYLTSAPASYADLSLTKTVSNATPAAGTTVDYTLTVTNAATSPTAAAGVTVTDILPAGTTFNSVVSGTGTYNSGTGIWTLGAVPIGASRNIVIRVNVTAGASATVANIAEIRASSVVDLDSTPNNSVTTEDDYARVTFTVAGARVAGTPPTLTCPVGSTLFDWDITAPTWTAGSTNNSYALTNVGNINYTLSNPGAWLNNATYGGQSPTRQSTLNGSFTGQNSLWMGVNLASLSQSATAVITLPTAVPGVQFRIFDVDFGTAQYADRVTVTGTFNGSPVTPPILTNNIANYVIGNTAYGDASSADTQANGNVVVTFQNPVDTITISYGNHPAAGVPSDPGQQWITLHDLTFCNPTATLSVTKISSVLSDGVSASNPKAIPGATVQYCITVQNNGSGTATNVNISDAVPPNVTYVANTIISGANCGTAATVEDDDATDGGEVDGTTASIAGNTISGVVGSLAPSATKALVFNTQVN